MLQIEYKMGIFTIKSLWFSDYPVDIGNCDLALFNSCKNDVNLKDFQKVEDITSILDLTQSLDQISKNMCQSTRRSINKAIKYGIIIKINENYEEFIDIVKYFRKSKRLTPFKLTAEFMKKNATLFVAELNGEILSGHLYLEDKNNMYWYLSASKRLNCSPEKAKIIAKANRLMVWEAIKYSKDNGIKEFDLGGFHVESNSSSVVEDSTFKERFGGRIVTRYYYKKHYSKTSKLALIGYKKMCSVAKNLIFIQNN
jgi:lipid II:glycine glycyltransferase (peptidoglycan interpeptide bridge formation enzyme)